MCSINVFDLVDEVLDEKMQNNETFTAYDVTLAVRQKTTEQFFHKEVRNYIHDSMTKFLGHMAAYEEGVNSTYGAREYRPVKKQAIQRVLGTVVKRGNRNRVTVHKDFLEKIGVGPGLNVGVGLDSNKKACVFATPSNSLILKQVYKIDSKGNFKISNKILNELGVKDDQVVMTLDTHNRKILLS